MKVLLTAGFGAGLAPDLPLIDSLKFGGVRRDVTIEHIDEYVAEFVPYPNLYLLCILQSALSVPASQVIRESRLIAQALVRGGLATRSGIEIGNEPNLTAGWGKDEYKFQACVNACYQTIRDVSATIDVVSGGVSNTGTSQQAWLKIFLKGLDPAVVVGVHSYRTETHADAPKSNYASRDAEQAALVALLGTRRRMMTETGWHCLPQQQHWGPFGWFTWKVQWTEPQNAVDVQQELHISLAAGYESATIYQLNDAVPGGFGIRRYGDGSLKPVAAVAATWATDVPPPVGTPVVTFHVSNGAGASLANVEATFALDDASTPVVTHSNATGTVTYRPLTPGVGVWVTLVLAGYDTLRERRLIPTVSTAGPLPEWPATATMIVHVPTRDVGVTVTPPGASGTLATDAGPSFTSTADAANRLTFTIPETVTGGATLHLTLTGHVPCDERVLLDAELHAPIALVSTVKPLPPIPTREQVCRIKMSLQGLTYQTAQYGAMPGVFFWSSYADRKTSVFPAHRAVRDTHLPVGVSGSYNEPSTVWPPEITKGGDITDDLPAFKRQLREVIDEGFFCDVPLSGDGESVRQDGSVIHKGEYNDMVGSTYGYTWLMQNLVRILKAIRGDADSECPDGEDLTPYCIIRPGWDSVFYGWEPSREKLRAFGALFRSVLPNGHLAIEHNTGHIPAGEGVGDWQPGGCMYDYDTLLSEYNGTENGLVHDDAVWQIAARTLGTVARGGTYVRPPDQPADDDPGNPPWYLQGGNPRGPYYSIAFEFSAYWWSRGKVTREQNDKDRAYLTSIGYPTVC